MKFMGINVAEWAAFLGIISIFIAAGVKFYSMFRIHITAPLIEAVDKLRVEISQLEHYLVNEYQVLSQEVNNLRYRIGAIERQEWNAGKGVKNDACRVTHPS